MVLPLICSHRMQRINGRCPKCYAERINQYSNRIRSEHRIKLTRIAQIRERRRIAEYNAIEREILRRRRLAMQMRFRRQEHIRIINLPEIQPPTNPIKPSHLKYFTRLEKVGMSCAEVCSICCEQLKTTVSRRLKCNHRFHKECIDQWFMRQNTCPCCREVM